MATLSSVPKVPSSKLDTKLGSSYQPRVTPFERSRPRSRVLIISRQSSRNRRNSKASALSPSSNRDSAAQKGVCPASPSSQYRDIMRSWTPRSNGSTIRGKPNHNVVSDIPSSAQSSYSHEPTSIDLDSFPVPPIGNQPWKYPSTEQQYNAPRLTKREVPHCTPSNGKAPVRGKYDHQDKSRLIVSPLKPATAGRQETPVPNVQTDESASQLSSALDPALIDAISKSVAEHLRLAPSVNNSPLNRKTSKRHSVDQQTVISRTPSQAQALDTFTKELHRYADRVGAKGKVPIFTPTPVKSPTTLQTVSALLPFRNEFRAAGLAVTSKDQKRYKARALHDPTRSRRARTQAANDGRNRVSQMDGRVDSCSEPTTVVDFMDPSTADSWRRALVNEIPPRRHSIIPRRPRSPRACFPCLPGRLIRLADSHSTPADRPASQASQIARIPKDTVFIPARGPSTPFKRSSNVKGVRPKGFSVQPTQDNTLSNKTSPVRDRAGPSVGVPGLKASKSSATVRMTPKTEKKEEAIKRTKSLHEGQANRPELNDDDAAERPKPSIEHRSRPWTQNVSDQQAHSLPTHSTKWPRPAKVQDTFVSMPELPTAQGRKPGKIPPLNALREFLTKSVTSKAMQEMNRHDLGRYPTQLPSKHRPSIWSTNPPDVPRRTSSKKRKQRSGTSATDISQVEDRNVLQGLHIAAAAECDENINILVLEKTGVHIRRFLADLMAVESLSLPQPGEDRDQQAKRRRYQMRRLKRQMRTSRELIGQSAHIMWGGR